MRYRQFVQKNDKDNIITVAFSQDFTATKIIYNNSLIGSINSKTELINGQTIQLPNESEILIRLNKKNIIVEENGKKLKSSPKDLNIKLNTAYGVVIFIGLVNILISILVLLVNIKELSSLNPIGLFLFGITFLVLSPFIKKSQFIPLLLATILFISDMIITIIFSSGSGYIGTFTFKIFLIISMVQGLIAIPKIKRYEEKINKMINKI